METMQTQEMISALADGQLRGEAFARGVEVAAADPAALEAWQTYHLIGEVLRSGEVRTGMLPTAFLSRVQAGLQQEEGLHAAPARLQHADQAQLATGSPAEWAANDASFRWKLVAGLASLTAMAAIGWSIAGGFPGKPQEAQLASAKPGGTGAAAERGVMIRDPRLDEFLAAHRQLGGASALQMPAGFLRNATFESANR